MLDGIIIYYSANNARDITAINSFLFGRVVKTKQHGKLKYYFYPGRLDEIFYIKLSNGSYFISDPPIIDYPGIEMLNAELDIKKDKLITAREYFRNYYNGIEVNNL